MVSRQCSRLSDGDGRSIRTGEDGSFSLSGLGTGTWTLMATGDDPSQSASTSVVLGLVQMRCGTDPTANLRTAVSRIGDAAQQGAQIVCLQELFRSQYFCQVEDHRFFDLAEPIPGPSTEALTALAKELGVVIVASLFEKRAEGLYHNTAATRASSPSR